MVKNDDTMRQEMEKAYPGYKFLDAEVKYNQDLAMFYIYARMIKHGSCEDMQKGEREERGVAKLNYSVRVRCPYYETMASDTKSRQQ